MWIHLNLSCWQKKTSHKNLEPYRFSCKYEEFKSTYQKKKYEEFKSSPSIDNDHRTKLAICKAASTCWKSYFWFMNKVIKWDNDMCQLDSTSSTGYFILEVIYLMLYPKKFFFSMIRIFYFLFFCWEVMFYKSKA